MLLGPSKNYPTKAYFFLVKQISEILNNKKRAILHSKRIIYGVVNKKHVNKNIGFIIVPINKKEL